MSFETITRNVDIDGFDGWIWPAQDSGAWDGPVEDWKVSHVKIIDGIPNRRTVIQAGGNLGLYPVLLSKKFEHVFTVEPFKGNHDILVQNVRKHNCSNVTIMNAALGPADGYCKMQAMDPSNLGIVHTVGATLSKGVEGMDTAMFSIDSMWRAGIIPNDQVIDMIWLDVEGFEMSALIGAKNVLTQFTPLVMAERPSQEVVQYLAMLGYNHAGYSKMDGIFVHNTRMYRV